MRNQRCHKIVTQSIVAFDVFNEKPFFLVMGDEIKITRSDGEWMFFEFITSTRKYMQLKTVRSNRRYLRDKRKGDP